MIRFAKPEEMKAWSRARQIEKKVVSFVPTMGALHAGHLSLVKEAQKKSDQVVVSIFVNPTQFNNAQDLETYPHRLEQDMNLLREHGVDVVFTPEYPDLYPDGYRYRVSENELSQDFCGKDRPGHFDGVLTVVLKLLMLVNPKTAYFGEKDYQQFRLIRGMAESFFLDVDIIGLPTIREADGLAMSSRNLLLKSEHRQVAPMLYKILKSSPNEFEATRSLQQAGFEVGYVRDWHGRRFAAAKLGEVRLIDNVEL